MNKLKNLVGKNKFHVYLRCPAKSQPIEIRNDGNTYYRIELGKEYPVGGIYDLIKLLFKFDARLAAKKGNRFRAYQFFFSRNDALSLLREGYSVISVETLSTLSFDEKYTHIISSDGKSFEKGSLPCGFYSIAFNEPKQANTYNKVEAEHQRAMEAEAKLREETERQAREAARKAARQKELESTNVTEPEPVENGESTFLKLAGAAAIFLAGVGLGAFIKNN